LPTLHDLLEQVVVLHLLASQAYRDVGPSNLAQFVKVVEQSLTLVAAFGLAAGAVWRLPLAIPLVCWYGATLIALLVLVPLFWPHTTALVPPMVCMAALSAAGFRLEVSGAKVVALIGALAVALVTLRGFKTEMQYYAAAPFVRAMTSRPQEEALAVRDLRIYTREGDEVVTDAQYLAAKADRDTPPLLVDSSFVRIKTGSLRSADLIAATFGVRAVLFYTGRLASVVAYRRWTAQHFRRVRTYGPDRALWIRV